MELLPYKNTENEGQLSPNGMDITAGLIMVSLHSITILEPS